MAATPELASRLECYLQNTFRPDCDFVDGQILERNVGEHEHAFWQKKLILLIGQREADWGVLVYPELRVQVADERYRIPDVCVVPADARFDKVLTHPPLICIEILSSEDRWSRITERFEDYRRMGVPTLWAVDPLESKAWMWSREAPEWRETTVLEAPGTPVRIDVSPVFAELAERKAQK